MVTPKLSPSVVQYQASCSSFPKHYQSNFVVGQGVFRHARGTIPKFTNPAVMPFGWFVWGPVVLAMPTLLATPIFLGPTNGVVGVIPNDW